MALRRVTAGLVFVFLATASLHSSPSGAAAVKRLVLVASVESTVPPLTIGEVRKLFLGIPMAKKGLTLQPLINISDPLAHQVFLQKIIAMSAGTYERHLIARVFRLGGHRPAIYKDLVKLTREMQENSSAVSYMWAETADQLPHLKVVQELWQGTID